MTNLEIIQLICLGVITIAFLVILITKAIKNKWLDKLTECVKIGIKEAEEKWPEGHGSDKMAYVLEKVKIECEKLGIPYLLVYKLIKILVNKIVDGYNTIVK